MHLIQESRQVFKIQIGVEAAMQTSFTLYFSQYTESKDSLQYKYTCVCLTRTAEKKSEKQTSLPSVKF